MTDLPGLAIADYYLGCANGHLMVEYSDGSSEEMPVCYYFRGEDEMPGLELVAIQECRGRILEVGAGAGSHALVLQSWGREVTALDISPLSVDIMKRRGLRSVVRSDVFLFGGERFDTILMLMNGIGIVGNLKGLRALLGHLRHLLLPGGQLLFDSSDVSYLYADTPKPEDRYFGEVQCRYSYRRFHTDWFSWLYLDYRTLSQIASEEGWSTELLLDDGDDQYLVRLTRSKG